MAPRPRAPHRALWLIAWRAARAYPARHLLIVGLVTLAVAAASLAGIVARTSQVSPEARTAAVFGAADVLVTVSTFGTPYEELGPQERAEVDRLLGGPARSISEDDILAAIAAQVPGDAAVAVSRRVRAAGMASGTDAVDLLAADVADPRLTGLATVDGPAPGPGEALVSPGLLASADVSVGDTLDLPAIGRVRVVGTAASALPWQPHLAVVDPATELTGQVETRWHIVGIDGQAQGAVTDAIRQALAIDQDGAPGSEQQVDVQPRLDGWSLQPAEARPAAIAALVAAILLSLVGFVATAALATGARRRVREFGLLAAAAGADPEHVRGLVRREALVLGAAGAALGCGLALVAAPLGLPLLRRFVGLPAAIPDIAVVDLAVPAVLALLALWCAAWAPARTVARVPVTTALAGRVPVGRVPGWITPAALALSGAGLLLLLVTQGVVGRGTGYSVQQGLGLGQTGTLLVRATGTTLGVAAFLAGVTGLGVPLLAALARHVDRLPAVPRLAVRDSARQRTRSAAAVAVTTIVLAVPVLVVTMQHSEGAATTVASASRSDLAIVRGPWYAATLVLSPSADTLERARAALPPIEREVELPLVRLADDEWGSASVTVRPVDEPGEPVVLFAGQVGVATPEVVSLLGFVAPPPGGAVLLDDWGEVPADTVSARLDLPDGRSQELEVSVVTSGGAALGLPSVLLAPDALDDLGLQSEQRAIVLELAAPIRQADATSAWRAADAAQPPFGLSLTPEEWASARVRAWLTPLLAFAAAALGALILGVMTAALTATESDRQLGALDAIGADPRLRPRFRAVQAGYHAALAALLALPAGLGLAVAVRLINRYPDRLVIPLLALAVGLVASVIAVALPFLLSRRGAGAAAVRRPT